MQTIVKKCFGIKAKDLTEENKNEVYFRDPNTYLKGRAALFAERKRWESAVPPDPSKLAPK